MLCGVHPAAFIRSLEETPRRNFHETRKGAENMSKQSSLIRSPRRVSRGAVALACACLLVPGEGALLAQTAPAAPAAPAAAAEAPAKLSPDQLDSLVAPIALYPDPLLAQTPRGVHLPARDHPAPAVARRRTRTSRTRRSLTRWPSSPGTRPSSRWRPSPMSSSGSRTTSSGRPTSATPSSPSRRRDGRVPADAEEGQGQGRAEDQRAAEGRDEGRRAEDGHHRRVGEPRGHLRAESTARRSSTRRPSTRTRRSTTRPIRLARRSSPSPPAS